MPNLAPNLAEYRASAQPAVVGEQLARAVATLLCRGLEHPPARPCAGCLRAGRALARPVGRALLHAADPRSLRSRAPARYAAIGAALEQLELEAGIKRPRMPRQRQSCGST